MGDAGNVARLLFSSIFPKPIAFPEETYEQVLLLATGVVRKLAMNVCKLALGSLSSSAQVTDIAKGFLLT